MSPKFDKGSNPWSSMFGPGATGFGKPNFRWRIFDRGDLKYMILELLKDRPMHGYEVMRALEETSGGAYTASPGSVYPTLQSLEDDGYVSSEESDGRKVYTITDEGREFLDRNQDRVEQILRRIGDYARHFSGAPMSRSAASVTIRSTRMPASGISWIRPAPSPAITGATLKSWLSAASR